MENSEDPIERKFILLIKILLWFIAFVVIGTLSLPGIIISVQYRKDSCVTKTGSYNIYLDWWLLSGSLFQLLSVLTCLPCVCFQIRKKIFAIYTWILNCLALIWIALGILLLVKSDLKTCEHDSLWVMSLVYIIAMSIWNMAQIFYEIVKCMDLRVSSSEDQEDHLNNFVYSHWRGEQIQDVYKATSSNDLVNLQDEVIKPDLDDDIHFH